MQGTYIDKLIRAHAMLSNIRHYLPEEQIISVYNAIFSSHLSYDCQLWSQNDKSSLFQQIYKNVPKEVLPLDWTATFFDNVR